MVEAQLCSSVRSGKGRWAGAVLPTSTLPAPLAESSVFYVSFPILISPSFIGNWSIFTVGE